MRLIKIITAFLLMALAIANEASAQVVKITVQKCGSFSCKYSYGSGVVVNKRTAANGCKTYSILTAYHLTGNEPNQLLRRQHGLTLNVLAFGGRIPAQIQSYNGQMLLMLLTIDVPAGSPEIPVISVADALPNAGDAVEVHGFSHARNGQFGSRSLELRSVAPDIFTVTSPFEQGESGGPITKSGKLIGLCEGFYAKSQIGFGPSVVAIRRFLDLPAINSHQGGQSGSVSVRPGLQVSPGGAGLPVPPPPAEPTPAPAPPLRGSDTAGDAPEFIAELGPSQPVGRVKPVAEPDPISVPIPNRDKSETQSPSTHPAAGQTPQPGIHGNGASAAAGVAKAALFGWDLWSLLAGGSLVAGTGGIGAIALLAWRGLKVGRVVGNVIHHRPIVGHSPLPPTSANFVQVPVDYRRESVDWALAQVGRKYPGSIGTLDTVVALINQHLQANGHGPETLHQSPVSN